MFFLVSFTDWFPQMMRCFHKFLCIINWRTSGGYFLSLNHPFGAIKKITHTQTWQKIMSWWHHQLYRKKKHQNWSWWIVTVCNFPPLQFISLCPDSFLPLRLEPADNKRSRHRPLSSWCPADFQEGWCPFWDPMVTHDPYFCAKGFVYDFWVL